MTLTEFLDKIDETARAVNPTSLSVEKRMVCLSAHEALALTAALRKCVEALEKCNSECSMDDPNFGNFTPLQFAARLGLIYGYSKDALASLSEIFQEMK